MRGEIIVPYPHAPVRQHAAMRMRPRQVGIKLMATRAKADAGSIAALDWKDGTSALPAKMVRLFSTCGWWKTA
ncbi:MAG: hypothetical protein R3D32_06925 [Nitratireductor sp.]